MNKLNLKIKIDINSGFCFGVTNAINKAENILQQKHELFCLGELVHNKEELRRLEQKRLKIIKYGDLPSLKNKRVLFRAHGEPPESYKLAKKNNNTIIDASCPTIIKIQKQIKDSYNNKENIYIFGKHNHPEIIGLTGQVNNNAIVFEDINELKINKLPRKLTLFSQTTKDINSFFEIVDILKQNGIDVKVQNTICKQVYKRQEELNVFAKGHNKIIFIADKSSSNGKVLFDECKNINPETYFVSSVMQIKKEWFNKNESVGICGATSTPMWLMKNAKKYLEAF